MVDGGDDHELVDRCLRGDLDAFAPLVARYQKPLFNVALRMVRDREDARDITQTAFVKAYEKLRSFDRKHRFFSWIYRIAVNECLNFVSRRRPERPLLADMPAADDPQRDAEASELAARVQGALVTLTPDYRLVVILRHFLGLSYVEMSETLLIPEKTVRSRLYTARQRLAEVLRSPTP
ncbi:MAG TPA: sigma-70 family RNA polymerase sigma factor [Vicinamibacteria bacterium]|nr:sigma-70 family RNA polymerase sigma factor [Vicinamibacteria bacterium]